MVSIDGHNNIVIKDIYGSTVTIHYNDLDKIRSEMTKLRDEVSHATDEKIRLEVQIALELLSKLYDREIFPDRLTTIPNIFKEDIIGREPEMLIVDDLLKNNNKVVLVSGIGGIGKTTLAKAYFNEHSAQIKHSAWIEVTEKVTEAFVFNRELVDSLGLREILEGLEVRQDFITEAFGLIINRMRQLSGNNLLIIDNANDDIEDLDVLDRISLKPYWKVLVTSRSKLIGFAEYELGVLSPENALRLFYTHYNYEKNDEIVAEILKAVQYHTLTIEVLSKTAEVRFFKLTELLELVKKKSPIFPGIPTA